MSQFIHELNQQLEYLFAFAREKNELDFAMSLSPEMRGAQDAGWSTVQTAIEVFEEAKDLFSHPLDHKKIRIALGYYLQIAEAGGFYESLRNIIGIIEGKECRLWPFKHLVRVKKSLRAVVAPNANATFRDLSNAANRVGLERLSELLSLAFDDEIRNAYAHADYIFWEKHVRLRKRNGGPPKQYLYREFLDIISTGFDFFSVYKENLNRALYLFDPPKKIIGRLSANPPMEWRVSFTPSDGSFRIEGDSPGIISTPESKRRDKINEYISSKFISLFCRIIDTNIEKLVNNIRVRGFEPAIVVDEDGTIISEIEKDADSLDIWDRRIAARTGAPYIFTPFGLCSIGNSFEFSALLPETEGIEIA